MFNPLNLNEYGKIQKSEEQPQELPYQGNDLR